MNSIQFIQTSPDELSEKIIEKLSKQLNEIKANIPHPEQLLTREQTAELLHVDLSTLWSWTKKGKLIAYGIGNRVYYKRSEIEKCLTPLNEIKIDKQK